MAKTAGNWRITLVGVAFLALQPQACRDEVVSHPLATEATLVETYLQEDVSNIVLNQLEQVEPQLDILLSSLEELATDVEVQSSWDTAQSDWVDTVMVWQPLEMMQIASLGSSITAVGGEDIRDNIYSWPLVNPCRIDQVTAPMDYEKADFVETALVSVRGLDAMEHLLFGSLETDCPSQVPPVSDGTWSALSDVEIHQRRVDYAIVLVKSIQDNVDKAISKWSNGYPMDLYESPVKALNAVFDAMLYMEEGVKERKLSYPMGLTPDCDSDCSVEVEGVLAQVSIDFVVANLQGMTLLLEGQDSGGMLAILDSVGEEELSEELWSIHQQAVSEAEALQSMMVSMEELTKDQPEELTALLDSISVYTRLLKWDVAAVLELQVPQSSAGDND
jgi:uncharacterized protein